MKLLNYALRLFLGLFLICIAGCELWDSGGGSGDDNDNSSDSTDQTWDSSKIDGIWQGKSSSSQVDSTLIVSSSGNSISGSLLWPDDTRSVSGTLRWANSAGLYVEGGDYWAVSWQGNSLVGTATKPNGETYPVSFTR